MVNSREKDSAKILHWRLVGFETNSASNFRHDLEYLLIYHNLLINQLFLPMVMSVLKNLVVDLNLAPIQDPFVPVPERLPQLSCVPPYSVLTLTVENEGGLMWYQYPRLEAREEGLDNGKKSFDLLEKRSLLELLVDD